MTIEKLKELAAIARGLANRSGFSAAELLARELELELRTQLRWNEEKLPRINCHPIDE